MFSLVGDLDCFAQLLDLDRSRALGQLAQRNVITLGDRACSSDIICVQYSALRCTRPFGLLCVTTEIRLYLHPTE